MKNATRKKLTKYIGLGILGAITSPTNAEIIYVDIDPDHSIPDAHNTQQDEFFNIVIDGDSVMRIGNWNGIWTSGSWNGLWAICEDFNYGLNSSSSNAIIYNGYFDSGGAANDGPLADTLNLNDIIGSTANWTSWGWLGLYSYWVEGLVGNFSATTDKYLGARFNINGSVHYGWLRFDVDTNYRDFILKDYAYQDCPNFPIRAGQTSGASYLSQNMGSVSFCDSAQIGGQYYYSSQMVHDTVSVGTNCDSIYVYDLTINNSHYAVQNYEGCDSVIFNSTPYYSDTTWTDNLTTGAGCDSIITRNIIVNTSYSFTNNVSINEGDSVMLGGSYQTLSGTYVDSLLTAEGCNYIITTNLTVIPPDGILELNNLNINVYPNPSTGVFNIDVSKVQEETINYRLINNLGEIVKSDQNVSTNNFRSLTIEVPGVYFLEIKTNKSTAIIKLVKN